MCKHQINGLCGQEPQSQHLGVPTIPFRCRLRYSMWWSMTA